MATKAKAASTAKPAVEQPATDQTTPAALEITTTPTATQNTAPASDAATVTTQDEDEVTGDGTGTTLPELTHRIAATPERGFYRAGRHWPREGIDVHRDDFADEQWLALEAEPRLVITTL